MAKKKTPEEMERAKIEKAARTLIRLKHSLKADEELNEVLPDALEQFDNALVQGELKQLRAGLADILEDAASN